jgi:hypothetical protein
MGEEIVEAICSGQGVEGDVRFHVAQGQDLADQFRMLPGGDHHWMEVWVLTGSKDHR